MATVGASVWELKRPGLQWGSFTPMAEYFAKRRQRVLIKDAFWRLRLELISLEA